jgi:hypothetical protein
MKNKKEKILSKLDKIKTKYPYPHPIPKRIDYKKIKLTDKLCKLEQQ